MFAKSLVIVAAVLLLPAPCPAEYDGEPVQLNELVEEAIAHNPRLKAARHQVHAATARINQATAWAAPQIGVDFFETPTSSFPNPVKDGQETDYFVQQMFPFPGKLSPAGDAASSNASMLNESYRALERTIVRDLKRVYYELYLTQRKIGLNAENQQLMKRFVEIALKQYEVGMGKQLDVLRGETELSSLVNEGISLQREKKVTEAMINTILARPTDNSLGYVPDVDALLPPWSFDELRSLALENRADLKAMHYNIAMMEAELSASKREYYPDIMVRLAYKNMTMGDDFWSAMVAMNVPFAPWSGAHSKVEESQSHVEHAKDEYESMKNMVLFEVQEALVKVEANQNLTILYGNTVIPQAEQTLESTVSSYQAGKTEFLMLIDAYRMLLMSRLNHHMAIMSFMTSQAELEQAIGLDIEDISRRIQ